MSSVFGDQEHTCLLTNVASTRQKPCESTVGAFAIGPCAHEIANAVGDAGAITPPIGSLAGSECAGLVSGCAEHAFALFDKGIGIALWTLLCGVVDVSSQRSACDYPWAWVLLLALDYKAMRKTVSKQGCSARGSVEIASEEMFRKDGERELCARGMPLLTKVKSPGTPSMTVSNFR